MEVVDGIAKEIVGNYKRDLDAFFKEFQGFRNRTPEEVASLFVYWMYKRRRRLCLA